MEEGAGRRQDTFGLREIGLNLSTTQGDAQSMMYTQDSTVDTVMQPIGVATSRDDPASKIGKRLQKNTRKVTLLAPRPVPLRRRRRLLHLRAQLRQRRGVLALLRLHARAKMCV